MQRPKIASDDFVSTKEEKLRRNIGLVISVSVVLCRGNEVSGRVQRNRFLTALREGGIKALPLKLG